MTPLTVTKSIVIHPFLFAIFPVLFLFSSNIEQLYVEEITVPVLIMITAAFLLWILLRLVLKDSIKSGLIVSLVLALFFSYGHIYMLLTNNGTVNVSHELLLIPFAVSLFIGVSYFIKTQYTLQSVTTIVNVMAITLIGMSLLNIGMYYSEGNIFSEDSRQSEDNLIIGASAESFPDIYFIILDEYSDTEILKKVLGYDNQEFIDYLIERGFYIAPKFYSNYAITTTSVPSTLIMDYIHVEQSPFPDGTGRFDRQYIQRLVDNNEVMLNLKSKGYEIYNINSASVTDAKIAIADIHLCQDLAIVGSDLEILLFRTTMLNPVHVQLFGADQRDRILCNFSELSKLAAKTEKLKFVFVHINIPHKPYLFGPNGEPIEPETLELGQFAPFINERYIDQTIFANKKMKPIIEEIRDKNSEAIIIIQSDHGMREGNDFYGQDNKEFLEKRFGAFRAYYFPGKGQNLLFDETTAVNTFRVLFNLYFDDDYEILEDKIWGTVDRKENYWKYRDETKTLLGN